jgi:beta-lactamase superfamily II metal-dependent hydrolase
MGGCHSNLRGIIFGESSDRMQRMSRTWIVVFCCLALSLCATASNPKSLQIYSIDVEGGQATLIVNPSGQSLLIDTGWPGGEGRDADRIMTAAHEAGLKQIDYVLITHYHRGPARTNFSISPSKCCIPS